MLLLLLLIALPIRTLLPAGINSNIGDKIVVEPELKVSSSSDWWKAIESRRFGCLVTFAFIVGSLLVFAFSANLRSLIVSKATTKTTSRKADFPSHCLYLPLYSNQLNLPPPDQDSYN